MTLLLLALLPWVAVLLFGALAVRFPRRLPAAPTSPVDRPGEEEVLPLVSIVVPARNEAATIETCLLHLAASRYPSFEIVVVDDRSDDATRALAAAADPGNSLGLTVVEGEPLPDGWLGKPWACWQGYRASRGDLLLFTDADTRHHPDLLERAVRAMDEDEVGALTLLGRQLLESFWEKVVQPQIFSLLAFRFPRLDRVLGPGRCRHTLANGQFILFRRGIYEAIEGHRSVRDEVVEDLRLAQHLCREGYRLSIRDGEDVFAVRMYRSLRHMVEGWSKNLAIAARQTLPRGLQAFGLPLFLGTGAVLWLLPPVVLAATAVRGLAEAGLPSWGSWGGWATWGSSGSWGTWSAWSALATGLSLVFWMAVAYRARIRPTWGILYPLGAAMMCFLLGRSWVRGPRVEWKGRTYNVEKAFRPDR